MRKYLGIFLVCLTLIGTVAAAASGSPFTVLYSISPHTDGSAYWTLEYRTPLAGETAVAEFNEEMLNPVTIKPDDVKGLMQRSARDASAATGRTMEIQNFTFGHSVQTTPTGTYGVIIYSFTWSGFAPPGEKVEIGDVFPMGLYLPRETTLVVHPPAGYSAEVTLPAPDQVKGDMTWYGPRSFAAGEPHIVLSPPSFPLTTVIGLFAIIAGGLLLVFWYRSRRGEPLISPGHYDGIPSLDQPVAMPVYDEPDSSEPEPDEPDIPLREEELVSIEERILRALAENGGELFQSDITRRLDAPKSTVSTALNILHSQGSIQKIRKGRENLIRRV